MQIFGVGPLELLLILVLALVIMGPQDMVGTARRLGRWIYQVVRSPTWRAIMETTQEFRDLPQKIVRDAGLDEAVKEIQDTANQVKSEMEATTREINSEMQAASNEISSELNTAALEVNSDLQQVSSSAELASGVAPFAAAASESSGETSTDLGETQATAPSLDELNPDSILWPDLSPETEPTSEDLAPVEAVSAPVDPYVADLETIAMALGGTMKAPGALELAPALVIPQTITPEMIANVPMDGADQEKPTELPTENTPEEAVVEPAHPWAPGLAISGPAELDMQSRFQAQMAEMEKSFEALDARILAQAETIDPAPSAVEEMILPPDSITKSPENSAPEGQESSEDFVTMAASTEEAVESESEDLLLPAQELAPDESVEAEIPADDQAAGFGDAEASPPDAAEEPSAG